MFRQRRGGPARTVEPPREIGAEEGGILPCCQPGCEARTGVACVNVDSRGRLCPTAWCPEHRTLVEGEPYCPLHALRRQPAPRADVHRLTDIVDRFATAAEDDVVLVLQEHSARWGGLVVAEQIEVTLSSDSELRCSRGWRLDHSSRPLIRVDVVATNRAGDSVVVRVDGDPINTIEGVRARLDGGAVFEGFLLREVLAPLSLALELRRNEASTDLAGIGSGRRQARR